MKSSITKRLILLFSAIILSMIFILIFSNIFFLEKFYISKNIKRLSTVSKKIISGSYNPSFIQNVEENSSIRIIFIDSNSLNNFAETIMPHKRRVAEALRELDLKELTLNESKYKIVNSKLGKNRFIVYATKIIYSNISGFLILFMPIEPIRESVTESVQFLIFIGIITLILGGASVYFTSKEITKPILEINSIAKSITNLDFSKNPNVKTNDELQELAESISTLSYELQNTISELNIANETLKNDIEKERELEKSRKEFISTISHELKTPISVIQGYAEALCDSVIKDEAGKTFYASSIIEEASNLNKMVNEMLLIVKSDSTSIKNQISHFNLSDLLLERILYFNILAGTKSITINKTILPNVEITSNMEALKKIIDNYITNAIKYSPPSSSIEINLSEDEISYYFSVTNYGSQISSEFADRIWEPFFRIDNSRTRTTGGTGLGLAIVKKFCEMFGFEYGFTNKESGVSFFIKIKK